MLSFGVLCCALWTLRTCYALIDIDRLRDTRSQTANQIRSLQSGGNNRIATCNSTSCYRYYTSHTKPYFIESWPEVDFDTGEFYGGEVPIDESAPSRTLFFIFKPSQGPPVEEVAVWLNGGPGCSSLQGFLQENGPILWQPGTAGPKENQYAWSKLTNMLWVEQPVGTGFAKGQVTATSEVDVAKDFAGFFKNWERMFGIKNYKIYLTGESYAGRYIPYISAHMLDQKDKAYFDLSGALMYDPCIGGCDLIQGVYPTYQFSLNNNGILNFNQTVLDEMEEISNNCGLTNYIEKYLQFPPSGIQPPEPKQLPKGNCDPTTPLSTAFEINPCFNPYHITDYCPTLSNPLTGKNAYFNRADVKKAIHAPMNVEWSECGNGNVFKQGIDSSPDSIVAALPKVIEATNRVLISNADWDAEIYTNGTLLVIQNMTWHGQLGFQSPPSREFVVPRVEGSPAQGTMGKMHYERGLQWVETYQAGHMQPQYQPQAAWRHLQWLLGRISDL